ncbi:MAG: response regulator transcription factor [Cyclobacteriaceae bacterium]|jgi:DNA-binding NarL/FixJ family response regulator|nr:response regulator transcription factor [Cyclobacteriaceae bacterium]
MEAFKINVCVVDDHQIFRKSLSRLIATYSRIGKVIEAENGMRCLELMAREQPHVVLLDLEMPMMNGMDCSEQILQKYPDVKVIILTMHDSEKYILHMMELGVHSFLLKNTNPEELEKAIYSVVDRDYYHNDLIMTVLRKSLQQKIKSQRPDFSPFSLLTEREQEVLRLLCEDKTTKEVAHQLGISEKTVFTHKLNIQSKLEVKTTVGMVRAAYRLGILS